MQSEIDDLYMRTQKPKPIEIERGTEMSRAGGQPSTDTLNRVVDLLVEHEIKLDALEHVMKGTNPLVHEFYLGTIEKWRAQKPAKVHQALAQMLESRPAER
jgi:hypothetical protein